MTPTADMVQAFQMRHAMVSFESPQQMAIAAEVCQSVAAQEPGRFIPLALGVDQRPRLLGRKSIRGTGPLDLELGVNVENKMTDNDIHHLMTQAGCGGTLTPAVRRFALACRAAIYSAEQAQIEAPLRAEIDRLNAQRRELQAERERLLDSLARAGLEASRMVLKERDRCAKAAAPEHIPYSDDEWRVRREVRDAILDA